MRSLLPEERKERIASYLAHQRTGVIGTIAGQCVCAILVWYRLLPRPSCNRDLSVDCVAPRWADVTHHLVQDSMVLLVVQASSVVGLRWFQI